MSETTLTPEEERVLEASADGARTIRRRRLAIITGSVLLLALIVATFVPISKEAVLLAFAVYVISVVAERIAYANAVLLYKRVIRKLLARSPPAE